MFPSEFTMRLLCHPATPARQVRTIEVYAARSPAGGLELACCLRGDMALLLIPLPAEPGPANGLWEHSCFEAFVALPGEAGYHEFNFSPSGQWAAFAFSGYRRRDRETILSTAPEISARLFAGRLELEAVIGPALLPPGADTAMLHIGLTAIVEAADTVDGSHSYWALRHPAALPDFHHRDGFVCELAPPRVP